MLYRRHRKFWSDVARLVILRINSYIGFKPCREFWIKLRFLTKERLIRLLMGSSILCKGVILKWMSIQSWYLLYHFNRGSKQKILRWENLLWARRDSNPQPIAKKKAWNKIFWLTLRPTCIYCLFCPFIPVFWRFFRLQITSCPSCPTSANVFGILWHT